MSVHDEVFGGDHSAVGRTLLAGLARRPAATAAVVAHRAALAASFTHPGATG
ncbi:MAG: hypothetical protein JWO67_125 [Streptosporangiaceae bacterium]|nr:hypothetical protein [Streptosporangiaceae bacterium]